jgi:hypothetical protein
MKASGCALVLMTATIVSGAAPERTVSTSRQFVVYGGDVTLRGAVSQLAEQTKANLLALLRQTDLWKTPVVVNLQYPQANRPELPAAALYFSQTGSGLKLQLDLTIARDFEPAAIERELLRAILLEIVYRKQPDIAPGTAFVEPPDWLLDGALAVAPGRDSKRFTEALEPIVRAHKIMELSDFLHQQPALLDSLGRSLYHSYAVVLVQWLVDQANGRACLARYIDNLHFASTNPLADLAAQFPVLGDKNAAEKNWKARVAQFGVQQGYELLTYSETEAHLQKLLAVKIDNSTTNRLRDFLYGKVSPAQSLALKRLSQELILLSSRVHPILRPIVTEYQHIATSLAAGKTSGLKQRLARLESLRTQIAERMNRIDDYLNWFEATQARAESGAFANYLNAVEEQSRAPRRHDPLSVYLDAIEEQFRD